MRNQTLTKILHTLGDIASSEMVKVVEPFKVFFVPEVDEEERKLIKFAKKSIPYCNPGAGYTYYEFIGRKYINSNRNIMALNKVFKLS